MKRQLDSKYKDLVGYVNRRTTSADLASIMHKAIDEGNDGYDTDDELWGILDNLYITPLSNLDYSDLIPTIIDIYDDNYELPDPKYYWRFNELKTLNNRNLFFGIIVDGNSPLVIDPMRGGTAERCTKTELNNYLSETELTADNFTPVEAI